MASPSIRPSALTNRKPAHAARPYSRTQARRADDPSTSAVAVCWSRLRDEPRVLDRDDRMVGESANQFDLPLGEGFHAGSHEDNAATLRE